MPSYRLHACMPFTHRATSPMSQPLQCDRGLFGGRSRRSHGNWVGLFCRCCDRTRNGCWGGTFRGAYTSQHRGSMLSTAAEGRMHSSMPSGSASSRALRHAATLLLSASHFTLCHILSVSPAHCCKLVGHSYSPLAAQLQSQQDVGLKALCMTGGLPCLWAQCQPCWSCGLVKAIRCPAS